KQRDEAHEPVVRENPNQNSMTQALGCYPIVKSVAASLDLNTLDNLSRTCRQIRAGLLQYRKPLLVSTLHCSREHLPVDPNEALRYRARASNWFYMIEDVFRFKDTPKAGQCARDMVAECRRCGTVICRNCAVKPPAPIILRDRHRRLCVPCTKAPLGLLVKPQLRPEFSLASDYMERAICKCSSDGVWLCQPCGKSIRTSDGDYNNIWRWRYQYTESLGGLGTGIGEGDRGVICGREEECCGGREREVVTDCDAEDAREMELQQSEAPGESDNRGLSLEPIDSHASSSGSISSSSASSINGRTPSPTLLGPGYERHEIEGIGGVVKKKLVRMVKIGACVPEFDDERVRGEKLGREIRGELRSWCGWCLRVIPGKKDYEASKARGKG
ncbi:hypothetical protein B0T26DRAFT_615043, partial [Lasiosphaeria miniovina]